MGFAFCTKAPPAYGWPLIPAKAGQAEIQVHKIDDDVVNQKSKDWIFQLKSWPLALLPYLLVPDKAGKMNDITRDTITERCSSIFYIQKRGNYLQKSDQIFQNIWFQNYEKSNQNTYFYQRPISYPLQWIQKGDLLGDCAASTQGELALGKNLLVAYMPWEGFNFEDAVLINNKVLSTYTSLHIEKYDLEISEFEKITNHIPGIPKKNLLKLDNNGIVQIGSWVQEGDILVGKIIPIASETQTLLTHEKLLYDIVGQKDIQIQERCLRVPQGSSGRIIRISYTYLKTEQNQKNSLPEPLSESSVTKLKTKVQTGTKLAQTFIDKAKQTQPVIATASLPSVNQPTASRVHEVNAVPFVPRDESGQQTFQKNQNRLRQQSQTKLFKMLSPAIEQQGDGNFKNIWNFIGYRTRYKNHLNPIGSNRTLNAFKKITIYIAEKREFQVGDKISGRHGNKGIISQIFSNCDMPYLVSGETLDVLLNPLGVPSRMNVGQILECLLGFTGQIFHTKFQILCFDEIYGYEASRSFIYSKIFELCQKTRQKWLFSKRTPGKLNIFDGRNGQLFHQSVMVGSTYLMKLIHIVDEKIHARGTGPYSLITQQPLRGRAKHGGQRFGEMEVWALQGFGSAYTLQELLTVKSDDLQGRNQIMQTLLKNTPLRFGTPESLRVVLRELQCLCLDLQLSTAQPQHEVMRQFSGEK